MRDNTGGAGIAGQENAGGPSARGWAIAFGDQGLQVAQEGFVVRGWRAGPGMEDIPVSVVISTPARPRCGGFITYVVYGPNERDGDRDWCSYRTIRNVHLRPNQRPNLAIVLRPRCDERRARFVARNVQLFVRTDDGDDRTITLPTTGDVQLDLRKPCFSTPSRQLVGTAWPGDAPVPPSAWPW